MGASYTAQLKVLATLHADPQRKFKPFQGKALRVRIAEGANGALNMIYKFAKELGKEPQEIFFRYYLRRKERVEPARLRGLHGEAFERYYRAVPALFPALTPYPEGASIGWSSDRMLRNREHWMIVGLAVVTLLLLWRAYSLAI